MSWQYDTVVRGGLVVSGSGICKADIGIKGETIASVESNINPESAAQIIDASGKYVLPGVIDVHCHPVYEDDMGALSLAAAQGGTTTLIHFAFARPGMRLFDTVKQFKEEGEKKSYLDFALHGALFDPASQMQDIPRCVELGVASFKMFMTYAKLKWMTDDYNLAACMDLISECGGLAMVHAENGLVTDYLEDRSLRRGEDQKAVFLRTRPDYLEAEAIFRALSIARVMGCPLYIVHLSTARGVKLLEWTAKEGGTVYVETCPQYLALTDDLLERLGPQAKIGPPLRTEGDREALWEAVKNGIVHVIASDHAPKKKRPDDPFFEAPYGSPQAETMLSVIYDEGVNKGRIGPCRLVEVLCENPAKIFGLYPRKGTIQVGADADIVIFDQYLTHTITAETQHSHANYTLYEGRECLGKPFVTMQRGRILLKDGQILTKAGTGKFLKTKITRCSLR